jgi:hypothetical protein
MTQRVRLAPAVSYLDFDFSSVPLPSASIFFSNENHGGVAAICDIYFACIVSHPTSLAPKLGSLNLGIKLCGKCLCIDTRHPMCTFVVCFVPCFVY